MGTVTAPPDFIFDGNPSDTDNSRLDLYVTDVTTGTRYRISARAGSGTGSTNDCATNAGWLPDGLYGRGDNDSNSDVVQMYKTWGDPVVRGQVWSLGNKRCGGSTSTLRTELFIHSNGIEGTVWNNSWTSNGCIKVSQHARNAYGSYWWIAYNGNNERLTVQH